MIIKEWFLYSNFNQSERYAISISDISIKKETEKAYLLYFENDFGTLKRWIPKSCIMSKEDIKKEQEKKENAKIKYENLVKWAKENGLRVRNKMKKVTILDKAFCAGLQVPAELI